MSREKIAPRWIGFGAALVVVGLLAWFAIDRLGVGEGALTPQPAYADDASRLNAARVAEVWDVPADPAAAEARLAALLARARKDGRRVSIAGARHTMGGHTIHPDGVVVNMLPFDRLELVEDGRILRAGAGARWSSVIRFLDAHGLSVAVMQSNNDFTVGGSISVNCHGWQPASPPIVDSVQGFRLMLADGRIVRCSREVEPELFSLAIGGYGLFGIILDADLRTTPNQRYRPEVEILPSASLAARFAERVQPGAGIGMAYARLSVVPGEGFLREAILTCFREAKCAPSEMPALGPDPDAAARRRVFRAQIGSDAGKRARWEAEKAAGELGARAFCSRNQLLDEGAAVYGEDAADRTDILAEYFVPGDRLETFLERARAVIPGHHVDLLNVTVRDVLPDRETVLSYARRRVLGLVMLFNQPRTEDADRRLEAMTRELIDAAIASDGTYYLPYRLHASPQQFAAAYPRAAHFFERKRHYDPGELFQNRFYTRYGRR
jgi:FAD/FMN-containing dehydrogenase